MKSFILFISFLNIVATAQAEDYVSQLNVKDWYQCYDNINNQLGNEKLFPDLVFYESSFKPVYFMVPTNDKKIYYFVIDNNLTVKLESIPFDCNQFRPVTLPMQQTTNPKYLHQLRIKLCIENKTDDFVQTTVLDSKFLSNNEKLSTASQIDTSSNIEYSPKESNEVLEKEMKRRLKYYFENYFPEEAVYSKCKGLGGLSAYISELEKDNDVVPEATKTLEEKNSVN